MSDAVKSRRKRLRAAGVDPGPLPPPTVRPAAARGTVRRPAKPKPSPVDVAPPASDMPPLADLDETDPKAVLAALIGPLRTIIHRVSSAQNVDTSAIGRLVSSLTTVSRLVAKLDGDFDLTESMLLRSKVFAPVREAILDAIAPFPGALEAVHAAMARLGGS